MNKSVFSAVVVVLVLGGWMASGVYGNDSAKKEEPAEVVIKPLMKVTVLESAVKSVQRYVTVQGQVEANRSVEIKVEVDGRISEIGVQEGQRIARGVSIATLSADYRLKQLAQAKAVLRQRNSDLSASRKLKKRGMIAENRLIADQAAVQTARAQLALIQHEVDSASILAPFAGVLNSREVELGDYMQKGNVVGVLVDDSVLKVTGQVPQKNVGDLQLNQAVHVNLSNGLSAFGNLAFISRVADSVTRSYRVEVTLDNPQLKRLIGLTASLKLPLGTEQGHLLPNSVLGLSTDGDLQVKLVDEKNQVSTAVVEIIRTDKQGFWFKGLAENITVITEGKDFVSNDEIVEPISAVTASIDAKASSVEAENSQLAVKE
ncbi:MAG: efflux RND transporter periplasmic adaptor subunit [Pseudomonadales bacterium]|nr:efflux RND transporter periplasmic adaptor subunit [Pseudomonadales bacterium]NRA17673.1 efflux RND transporter periplasmic adaptor subunit [Oceanospirillaceae bacterium]